MLTISRSVNYLVNDCLISDTEYFEYLHNKNSFFNLEKFEKIYFKLISISNNFFQLK